jgi:ABC-type nitrate/sulfonate/bicarbonate transport system substrate-binding protein
MRSPEWAALVTRKDSGISQVEDLKGKAVAVTRGADLISLAGARLKGTR